jgi:hypothetical protein
MHTVRSGGAAHKGGCSPVEPDSVPGPADDVEVDSSTLVVELLAGSSDVSRVGSDIDADIDVDVDPVTSVVVDGPPQIPISQRSSVPHWSSLSHGNPAALLPEKHPDAPSTTVTDVTHRTTRA